MSYSKIDVEIEVSVRKYPVDIEKLKQVLRSHRGKHKPVELALILGKPRTLVEHWFRKDKYFAIPDADIWFQLKELLGIETDEFDKSITEYEFKPGTYDMRNRIYIGNTSPTLTMGCGNYFYLLRNN